MKRRALLGIVLFVLGWGTFFWLHRPEPVQSAVAKLGTPVDCAAYNGLPPDWGHHRYAGMVHIANGSFTLGSDRGYAEERPLQQMPMRDFWIDRTEVTNAQFAAFVAATGYVTTAEQSATQGAAVFYVDADSKTEPGSWWHLMKDANWRQPDGASSNITQRAHEPVVDVSYADALAYAHWLGRELPTEAEWEYAAKAGRSNAESDRSLRDAQGRPVANFWQGMFPLQDRAEDGYAGRAPVGCYPANPWALHDMVGNVWEWTTDRYDDRHAPQSLAESANALSMRRGAIQQVIKGGSYLCSADYCVRARAASRQGQEADLPASHIGFRTILRT